jgi:calcineurin-binding protein cabin-1
MVNSSETAAKEEWVATVTQLLLGIEQALSEDSSGSILKDSSSTTGLIRLTNNLIQVAPGAFSPCPAQQGVSL